MELEKYGLESLLPMEIEKRSFEIIEAELERTHKKDLYTEKEWQIVKRCIHTSADFDYAGHMLFTHAAVEKGLEALRRGAVIVTDTNMARSGINKAALKKLGCEVQTFIADADVAKEAKARGETRSIVSMEKAYRLFHAGDRPLVFAIGNAPTALIKLYELIEDKFRPALVVGVPVGFVNVEKSKELIAGTDVPSICAMGRKGGSNIAAAIMNALLYEAGGR